MTPYQFRMAAEEVLIANLPDTPPMQEMTKETLAPMRRDLNALIDAAERGLPAPKIERLETARRQTTLFEEKDGKPREASL